jgi:hypothetical protein
MRMGTVSETNGPEGYTTAVVHQSLFLRFNFLFLHLKKNELPLQRFSTNGNSMKLA